MHCVASPQAGHAHAEQRGEEMQRKFRLDSISKDCSIERSHLSSKWLLTLTLSSSDQEMHGKFNFYWFLPAKLSIERSATQFQLIGCPDWFLRLNRMILSDGKPQVQQWLITTEPGQSFMKKALKNRRARLFRIVFRVKSLKVVVCLSCKADLTWPPSTF